MCVCARSVLMPWCAVWCPSPKRRGQATRGKDGIHTCVYLPTTLRVHQRAENAVYLNVRATQSSTDTDFTTQRSDRLLHSRENSYGALRVWVSRAPYSFLTPTKRRPRENKVKGIHTVARPRPLAPRNLTRVPFVTYRSGKPRAVQKKIPAYVSFATP